MEDKLQKGETLNHAESIDVYELLQWIQTESRNSVLVDGNLMDDSD